MNCDLTSIFSLQGKVFIITGAAGLLGRMHAEAIAAYGGITILIDLDGQGVEKLAIEMREKYGVQSEGYSVDITSEQSVRNNAEIVIQKFNRVDGLINNASNNPKVEATSEQNFSRLENFLIDNWNRDIEVGLTGAFLCSKYYGHKISLNPCGGVIVNISSDLGVIAPDQRLYEKGELSIEQQPVKPVSYSVVKSGLIGLTRYLSTYWISQKVRCNAICPGGVENGQSIEFINKISSRIPMNRLAAKNEYQGTLIWMLSEGSSYLNGAIVTVDGGRSAW